MKGDYPARRWGVNLIFTILALSCWGVSFYLQFAHPASQDATNQAQHAELDERHFYGDLAKDIGVIVFGLALVDMLWGVFGGDPIQRDLLGIQRDLLRVIKSVLIVDQTQRFGVLQIARKPTDIDMMRPVDAIDRATGTIEMCGYTLHGLFATGEFTKKLKRAVERGVLVRVCIGSPNNEEILSSCLPECRTGMPGQSRTVLEALYGVKQQLVTAKLGDKLMIRELKQGTMSASILSMDGLMLVVPYLQHEFTLNSPALLLVNSGSEPLFNVYNNEFDHIYQSADPYREKSAVEHPN